MTVPAKIDSAEIMEQVIIKGDLSKLTPQERTTYYMKVCESVGLNPLTRPFEYILLNSKLQLYALKACTEQLRGIHDVSVTDLSESHVEGVFIVTAKVKNGDGRTDAAKGAVPIAGLKGEALANAMMKAETKAKRRATLSLCGLGWLDESEIESIPGAKVVPNAGDPVETTVTAAPDPAEHHRDPAYVAAKNAASEQPKPADKSPPTKAEIEGVKQVYAQVQGLVQGAKTMTDIDDTLRANREGLRDLENISPTNFQRLKDFVTQRRKEVDPDPLNDRLPDFA